MIKKPAKTNLSVLGQACKLIPGHLVAKLARKHGVDNRARTFSPWSHVVSLLYALLRATQRLGAQLYAPVHDNPGDIVGPDYANRYIEQLWDSRWSMANASGAGDRVSTGIFDLMLRDSHGTKRQNIDNFEIVESAESAKINVPSSPTAHHPHPVGWL